MKTYTTMSLLLLAALSMSCSKQKLSFALGDSDGSLGGEETESDPRRGRWEQ